ncbi:Crp/Fnr family transcriptional regulator [Feifania hominis]
MNSDGVVNMQLRDYLPFWAKLDGSQQDRLNRAALYCTAKRGTILHNGSQDCVGVLVLTDGRMRTYTLSGEGREVTLYRLFERDMCVFSASCVMRGVTFDVTIAAESDVSFFQIPSDLFRELMRESAVVANYVNELIATRMSDVMWLLDQVMYRRMDARVAAALLEEAELEQSEQLKLTHEELARHLGSAREVITRMLKYLQSEGLVSLGRGAVCLLDEAGLRRLAGDSLR